MIAAFLLPFPLRGYRAPYLWVYYRLLSSFGERMLFVASEDYTRDRNMAGAKPLGNATGNAQRLHFSATPRHGRHEYGFCPRRCTSIAADSGGNPIALSAPVDERVPCLDAAFAEILSQPSRKGSRPS